MPTCLVCLNALKQPAALPCGHVFCYDCIVKVVRNVQPFTQQHFCPTCRAPYTISNVDPQLVPSHLRPHLTPAVRKLDLDFTISSPIPGCSAATECDRLRAENASLRSCCETWRKRAAVHAAASLGLVGLARLARDHALKMRKERIDFEQKYNNLRRKQQCSSTALDFLRTPPSSFDVPQLTRSPSEPKSRLSPAKRSASPCESEASYCSDCSECEHALKRRRTTTPEPHIKSSPSPSPLLSTPPAQDTEPCLA